MGLATLGFHWLSTAPVKPPLVSGKEIAILVSVLSFLVVSVVLFYKLYAGKTKDQKAKFRKDSLLKAHKFFSRFFLTSSYLAEVKMKLAQLSVYRKDEIKLQATKMLLAAYGFSSAFMLLSIILFSNMLIILICFGFCLVLCNLLIDKRLDNAYEQVLRGASYGLDAVRQEFSRTSSVVDALNDANYLDIVKKPMEEIYTILTSSNSAIKLQEFNESTPFRVFQTFAKMCYLIDNDGDTKDAYGKSNFSTALTTLISDLNSEIQKIAYRKTKFGKMEFMPLASIPAIPLITTVFSKMMPGTALIYNGIIGQIIQTVCVVAAVGSYLGIARINTSKPIIDDDRMPFIESLLLKRKWKQFARNIAPKNQKKLKIEMQLKNAMSKMSIEHLYLRKTLFAFTFSLIMLMTILVAIGIAKDFLTHSTQQLSLISSTDSPAYDKPKMKEMDALYLANPDEYSSDESKTALVKSHLPLLTDLQVVEETQRLKTKKASLDNTYFKWYYIWLVAATGYFGWRFASSTIKTRQKLMQSEAREDFLQLQTLVSILMNTSIDTLDLLYELSRSSVVHKPLLVYAYHSYPSDPNLALAHLRASIPLYDFKRFVDKLKLTTSELSMQEAFDSLMTERDHILKLREIEIQASINKKAKRASKMAFTPLLLVALGLYLFPMGYLGIKELLGGLGSI